MSFTSTERGKEVLKQNREKLYHLPKKYENLDYYIDKSLKETLFKLMSFVYKQEKMPFIYKHMFCFLLDNTTATKKVRKKSLAWNGGATTNRHISMLCALGLFRKELQMGDTMLEINKVFLAESGRKRPINVFSYKRYTEKELDKYEERARLLREKGITAGNISYINLCVNGLDQLAREVYPSNSRNAPTKKEYEFSDILYIMETIEESYGYITKQLIKDNDIIKDSEIDYVLKLFRNQIKEIYDYKPPTKEQIEQFDLKNRKYIYIRRT